MPRVDRLPLTLTRNIFKLIIKSIDYTNYILHIQTYTGGIYTVKSIPGQYPNEDDYIYYCNNETTGEYYYSDKPNDIVKYFFDERGGIISIN
jgi:hypothetical protein